MDRFVYTASASRIVFGADSIDQLPAEIERLGARRALVLCTPNQRGQAEAIADRLPGRVAFIFDEAAMHKVDYRLRFLPELVDEVRQMIADELEQEGTSPQEYLRFHCSALKDEHLQKVFGVEDRSQLTNDVFLKALKLGHVGIFPGQPERYFVLDFTLGSHFTDEVLVASADEDGVVDDEIVWES